MRGRVMVAFASLALISLALVVVRAVDGVDSDEQAADYVNAYRATLALPGLPADARLNTDARRWVEHLADTDSLSHDALKLNGWTSLGENVGRGVSVEVIQRAFEDSPSHEHNLVGDYTHLGVAVAARGNVVWVVQRFGTRAPAPVPAPVALPPTTRAPTTTTVTLAPPALCRQIGK